jgi:lipopolysaccharide/colanic/teichoic acid biosynthesis glycosyltransferase
VLKRSLDIALAGMLLGSMLPVLAVCALLIKLDSDGPILFCQERMGRNFKRFQLFKLRTMRKSAGGLAYTLGADPRITRVGRWLRWFKIDELPQLWNVLRGEMSLVGPRPVVPELAIEFKVAYRSLLKTRPGLTDPATVKYCREAEMLADVPEPFRYFKRVVTPDKLRMSESYLQNANGWSDLCVMASTAKALLRSIGQIGPSGPLIAERATAPIQNFKTPVRGISVEQEIASTKMDGSIVRASAGQSRGNLGPEALPPLPLGLVGDKTATQAGGRGLPVP